MVYSAALCHTAKSPTATADRISKRSIKATRYNYRPEVLTTPQHILKHVKPIIRAQQSPHKNTMSLLTWNPQNSDSPQKDWCPPDQKTDFPLSRPFSDSLLCSKPRGLQDDTDRGSQLQLSLRHQQGVTGLIFKKVLRHWFLRSIEPSHDYAAPQYHV